MVDQNPGRANPEISKLIGIMWKEGSQATRDEWLKHAEMEKKQHFLRYPEYRYQPRRHGKKSPGSTTGILSTAGNVFCNACGGKLGTNSVPNTPLTPSYPPATPQTPRVPVYQAAPFSVSVWDVAKKKRLDSRAGLEASLQLEVQRGDTENPDNLPQAKRRKANASAASSPIPGKVSRSKSSLLKRPLDNAAFYDTNVTFHQHGPQHTTTIPTSISVIQKFQAIKKIVQPLPTSLSTSRGVIIAIDGENVVQVNQFITILKKYMPESISRNILEKSPEGIQNENNDINVAIASYLGSVANWRLKAIKTLQASVSLANIEDSSRLNTISKYPLILLNRYILSRSNDAVETLVFDDGLTAAEHWQWCANIWRGNVGADMTIWVNENGPNGCVEILSGDLVIVSAGENGEWERTTIRRVVFEIGECMKDLGALE